MGNSISSTAVTIDRAGQAHYHPAAQNRNLNHRRDVHNHLHLYWNFLEPKDGTPLPPHVDLSPQFPPIYDQGNLGSCTANASTAVLQFDAMKQGEPDVRNPSRLFEYYNSRSNEIPPSPSEDSGASLAVSIACLVKFGVCDEADWPYDISKFTVKPGDDLYAKALHHKCTEYKRVLPTHEQLKGCLRDGYPFAFGIAVYDSMMTMEIGKTGIVPIPLIVDIAGKKADELLGGHAIVCVGYDDEKQLYKFRNSWGTGWGDKGYGYLPYAYLVNANLAYDMWSVRRVKSEVDV